MDIKPLIRVARRAMPSGPRHVEAVVGRTRAAQLLVLALIATDPAATMRTTWTRPPCGALAH